MVPGHGPVRRTACLWKGLESPSDVQPGLFGYAGVELLLQDRNALMSLNNEMYLENYTMRGETYTGCYDITIHQIDSSLEKNQCGDEILSNVLNTPGLTRVNTQEHLGSYSSLIVNIPGFLPTIGEKFDIELLMKKHLIVGGVMQYASSLSKFTPPPTPNIVLGPPKIQLGVGKWILLWLR